MAEKKRGFIFMDEVGREAAKRGQEYAKLVLDLLRNFVVVAVLFYAAQKSGKWYVWALAFIGFFALLFYIQAYIGQLQFYYGFTNSLLLRLFLMLVSLILVGVVSFGLLLAVIVAINEIASVQNSR
jgi:hypothetical protein